MAGRKGAASAVASGVRVAMIGARLMDLTSAMEGAPTIAPGSRTDRSLAFAATALTFYIAGISLPLATAAKFGEKHAGYLMSGVWSLWSSGNWHLAILVFACGAAAPLILTGSLCLLLLAARGRKPRPGLRRWLHIAAWVEEWSMPEVHLLGVIVAFTKISALVATKTGPGLWCYGLAAVFTIAAWRSFDAAALAATLFPARRVVHP